MEPVTVIGLVTPAGLVGMFEEIGTYVQAMGGRPDPCRIAEINVRYGVEEIGPAIDVPTASSDTRT
jgi:hypothetical protein